MVSAIILAAGLSSRMGRENKLLLPYNGKPVIATIVGAVMEAGLKETIVVTGHESELVRDALKGFKVRIVQNNRYEEGMTSSIQAGIKAATGSGYMICLSDMVRIAPAEYRLLEKFFEDRLLVDSKCISVPWYKNEKGNPVIFSAFYKDAILHNQEADGCRNIVQENKQHLSNIDMDTPHVLQDFDYPDDYRKIVAL